jgi:outer membrane protein OmpA-like peptidoglycan-associated protein
MKKLVYILTIVITLLLTVNSFPQLTEGKYKDPFSNTFVFSLEGGTSFGFLDYNAINTNLNFKIMGHYFFPASSLGAFGIRLFSGTGFISGEEPGRIPRILNLNRGYFGTGLEYSFKGIYPFYPYAALGAARVWYESKDGDNVTNIFSGLYSDSEWMLSGEIGIRWAFDQVMSFNLNGIVNYFPEDYLNNFSANPSETIITFEINAGFSYNFSISEEEIYIEPPPPIIDPPVDTISTLIPEDTDNDGLNNAAEDSIGTSIYEWDTDGDAISDYDEVYTHKTNPLKFDTDDGGIDDGIEILRGSDPLNPNDDVQALNTDVGVVTELEGITFAFGSTEITPESERILQQVYYTLKQFPDIFVEIHGHSDNVGSLDINMQISRERAEAVKQYLIEMGIDPIRIETVGFGPSKPIAPNNTEEGRARNRRIEFVRVK